MHPTSLCEHCQVSNHKGLPEECFGFEVFICRKSSVGGFTYCLCGAGWNMKSQRKEAVMVKHNDTIMFYTVNV